MELKEKNERYSDIWNSTSMTDLVIDLQEGFADDLVVLTVNDQVVYRNKHVSTDYSIGRADAINTVVEDETVWLEASLPDKQLHNKTFVNVTTTPFVAVSVSGNRITFKQSAERFIYF